MAKEKKKKNERFEKTLFKAADKLRKNMDAAEYKHIVLGLIFLKYISDSFEDLHSKLLAGKGDYEGADPEDADEYRAENVFWVPKIARWIYLHSRAKQPTVGKDVDDAMEAIEKENQTLKGILPKVYARPNLDKASLGGLIDLIGNFALGDEASKSKDILGRVYEYFLGEFAALEGKKGGQFYTPKSVVSLLVTMLEPYKGRVYDPCCGSGGMFVMSEKFVNEHQGRMNDISVYGQESNQTTYRLCRMNLAIRGIDGAQVKWNNEGSFLKDAHVDLKSDFVLANPPFNDSDWSGTLLRKDPRWKFGTPPASNANFAWLQHIVYHLSPSGMAGVVLADSSMSTTKGTEGEIRNNLVKAGLVDCMISLPSHLFSNTQITACLWFLARNKKNGKFRNRSRELLFIDASKMGTLIKRKKRILEDSDISKIGSIYHSWRNPEGEYEDIAGLCRSVLYDEVESNNCILSPNRYITPVRQNVIVNLDISDPNESVKLENIHRELNEKLNLVQKSIKESGLVKIGDVRTITGLSNAISVSMASFYKLIVKSYFIDYQIPRTELTIIRTKNGNKPKGWNTYTFNELFVERNERVAGKGYCPAPYSVTNNGIQLREGKFSKELSKSTSSYKIAYLGDIVFGLSREIPNLDVFTDEEGAFSPVYSIFQPKDIRIGLIVGTLMRLRLMEQTDILKGGAREGRGIDKEKLLMKTFVLPPDDLLTQLWGQSTI